MKNKGFKHKNKRNEHNNYSHFVGIILPEELNKIVLSCREYMQTRYGCSSGYSTSPHITLISPFNIDRETGSKQINKKIINTITKGLESLEPFTAKVSGFGNFGNRTIYLRLLENEQWNIWQNKIRHSINEVFFRAIQTPKRKFTPHITVANRDIPNEAFATALEYLANLGISSSFLVDSLTLFEFNRGRWEIV